jgi:tetratricopeptide (TPR) repeat protein
LERRQKILTQAEYLDFQVAKEESIHGENDLFYYQLESAMGHFHATLDILERIHFYQTLTNQKLIDIFEFNNLKKSSLLNLIKIQLEMGKSLEEIKESLLNYLNLENRISSVGEMEDILKVRGILSNKIEDDFDDMFRFSLRLLLYFKQNEYKEIIKIGRRFQRSFVMIPEEMEKDYVRVLQIVGDSYHKFDFLYDAEEFYQKAIEIDPQNINTILKRIENFERLNNQEKMKESREVLSEILSENKVEIENSIIPKKNKFFRNLIMDGSQWFLILEFEEEDRNSGKFPLITVLFNGKVVWENELKNSMLTIPVGSNLGNNTLVVRPLNQKIVLNKIGYQ